MYLVGKFFYDLLFKGRCDFCAFKRLGEAFIILAVYESFVCHNTLSCRVAFGEENVQRRDKRGTIGLNVERGVDEVYYHGIRKIVKDLDVELHILCRLHYELVKVFAIYLVVGKLIGERLKSCIEALPLRTINRGRASLYKK